MNSDPWKQVIITELICCNIYNASHDDDPRKALRDAIDWNVQVALDPKVSSDAQALIDRGAAQQQEHCIWARNGNQPCPHVQPAPCKQWVGLTDEERDKIILGRQARWGNSPHDRSQAAGEEHMSKEALRLALAGLVKATRYGFGEFEEEKSAISSAIQHLEMAEQPAQQQEPVEKLGERCIDGGTCHHKCKDKCFRREFCSPLSGHAGPWAYPAPTQQPLTDEQKWRMYESGPDMPASTALIYMRGVADAEAAYNIKRDA